MGVGPAAVGPDGPGGGPGRRARAVLGLRLSCDELAPWAGITPEQAPELAASLCEGVDYLVVVRGRSSPSRRPAPTTTSPRASTWTCREVRAAVPERAAVVLQGSVVDPVQAMAAGGGRRLRRGRDDRAQIADPDLVAKLVAAAPSGSAVHSLQPDVPGP